MNRRAIARISLGRLRHNCAYLRSRAPGSSLLAVLKADAYGHGAVHCAQALSSCCDGMAVSTLDEALELRAHGIESRIVVLHDINTTDRIAQAHAGGLDWVVYDEAQVELLERCAQDLSGSCLWLKINTGMNRLGIPPEQAPPVHARLAASGAQVILMTHLSSAGEDEDPATPGQLARFATIPLPGERSAANSAALLRYPESRLDWVRPGLALYGVAPGPEAVDELQPVMRLEAPLLCIQDLPKGAQIGYGGTYTCPEPMPVGMVEAGYADGYPYSAPGRAQVALAGRKTAVLGRISMDLTAIDLRGIDAAPGDPVELWGDTIRVHDLAVEAGTIAYDLLCRAGPLQHVHEPESAPEKRS